MRSSTAANHWHCRMLCTQGVVSLGQRRWNSAGRSTRLCVQASGAGAGALQPGAGSWEGGNGSSTSGTSSSGGVATFVQAFWKFLRPHTIRGTILGSGAVTARALLENPALIDWGLLPKALLGVVALLCGNGYIVGINQIYDVDIDKVNKPFLPIAAGRGEQAGCCTGPLALGSTTAGTACPQAPSIAPNLQLYGLQCSQASFRPRSRGC